MAEVVAPSKLGSDVVTAGIRVRAVPQYLPQHSTPSTHKFVFAYSITITNESSASVRLVARRWHIVDADGESSEVVGPGVVGQQPDLLPGESFDYSSYCPLETPWGTMEGAYTMQDEDGKQFPVRIGRFFLVSGK